MTPRKQLLFPFASRPNGPRQLPLQLGNRTAAGREDFLITEANAEAVALLEAWPAWSGPLAVLYGPAGAGKSHLAEVFVAHVAAHAARAVRLMGVADLPFDPPVLLAHADALVLDDSDAGVDEIGLFHLVNAVREAGKSLLILCRSSPTQWAHLPDLRSRLLAAPTARIDDPDDTVMTAVLVKLFADRQMRVPQDVIDYALRQMERTFAAAQKLVADVDALSLEQQRPVTIPLVKLILEAS